MVRTHVAMFKRRGMTVSKVADKVLYVGLIEMQKLDAQDRLGHTRMFIK